MNLFFRTGEELFGRNREDLSLSEQLAARVYRIIEERNSGDNCCAYDQIDNYLLETRFYKNPPVTPTPWKTFLTIGKIRIPIQSYVKVISIHFYFPLFFIKFGSFIFQFNLVILFNKFQ